MVVMLVGIGFLFMKAHIAAGAGLLASLAIAVEPDISPDLPQALATQHIGMLLSLLEETKLMLPAPVKR